MVDINLLAKKTQQSKVDQNTLFRFMGIPTLVALIIIIGIHFYYTPQISTQRAQNSSIQAEINTAQASLVDPAQLQQDEITIKKTINAILTVKYYRYIAINILKLISELTPKKVHLLSLLNKNGEITLIGNTYSKRAITDFLSKLSNAHYITMPKLGEIQTDKNTNLNSFKIIFSIKQPATFYSVPEDKKK